MIRKILIVSDSHRNNESIRRAVMLEYPDMLIHLGDIENDPEEVRGALDEAAAAWNRALAGGAAADPMAAERVKAEPDRGRIGLPVPAVFVEGNCDRYGGYELGSTRVFDLNGHRFFCTHGHRQGVSYGIETLGYTAMENECDIALFGHTHVPFDEEWEGVRILNPGSIYLPRGGSRAGYMVMSFDEKGDYVVERKELREKRRRRR